MLRGVPKTILGLIFFLAACRTPRMLPPLPSPEVKDLQMLGAQLSNADEPITRLQLWHTRYSSAYLLRITQNIPAHYHAFHAEQVYLIEGSGLLTIAAEQTQIKPGFFMHIPRGYVHAFEPAEEVLALAIFTPPLAKEDFVAIED